MKRHFNPLGFAPNSDVDAPGGRGRQMPHQAGAQGGFHANLSTGTPVDGYWLGKPGIEAVEAHRKAYGINAA